MNDSLHPPAIPDHRLERCIGSGNYGEVWLARARTGAWRAVKIVHRRKFEKAAPYEREFKGILNYEPISREHENLVDILHVGRDDAAGCFYCVMELADDATTDAPLATVKTSGAGTENEPSCAAECRSYSPKTLESELERKRRLNTADGLSIAISVAKGLAFLHERGLVHRDVKPSSVIFVNGVPKLADVGLIAVAATARSCIGTTGYMPPEGMGKVTADVYSLGILLYEMVTGQDRTSFPELPAQHSSGECQDSLAEINAIYLKACDPSPSRRHKSAHELLKELELLYVGASIVGRRALLRRLKVVAVLACVLGLVFTGLLGVLGKTTGLVKVGSFSHPGVVEWTDARTAQTDHDPEKELVLADYPRLRAFNFNGRLEEQTYEIAPGARGFGLGLVRDIDGDGTDEFFVHWAEGTNLVITALNMTGFVTGEFHGWGRTQADSQSHMHAREVIELANGKRGLIATVGTGYGKSPRGIRCFDFGSGSLLWEFEVAPNLTGCEFLDLNGDGVLDLVVGTGSPCNGKALEDGTDDNHSYLYGISAQGRLLWRHEIGGEYTGVRPVVAELDGAGSKEIFGLVFAAYEFRRENSTPEIGKVLKFDLRGTVVAEYDLGATPISSLTADLDKDGRGEILVTDRMGRLHILDEGLILKAKATVVPKRHDKVFLELDAVLDLDGDGRRGIVLHSVQQDYVSGLHEGHPRKPPTQYSYHDASFVLLSQELAPLATHVVAEDSSNAPNFRLLVLDLYGKGRPQILLLKEDVTVFEYRRFALSAILWTRR